MGKIKTNIVAFLENLNFNEKDAITKIMQGAHD